MSRRQLVASITVAILAIALGSVLTTRQVAAGGGGCHEPVTERRGTNVELKGFCMITTILRIEPGETVTFTNRDEADHTVTGAGIRSGDGNSFGSFEPIPQGKTLAHTFETNGVYVYYCAFHPGMVGAIVVGDGSGPGSASGASAAPLGVIRRAASDIAASGAPVISPASSHGGIDTTWIAALAGGAFIAVLAAVVALARRRSLRLRQMEP